MVLGVLPLAASHPTLTAFFSLIYLGIFLPACVVSYGLMPGKLRKYWLLLISWGFFWLVSGELIVFLLLSNLSMYVLGLWMDRLLVRRDQALAAAERSQKKSIRQSCTRRCRWVLALGGLIHIGMLLVLKYSGFVAENLNALPGVRLPVPDFVTPIGLSFFSLQAFSYLFDVYRETVKADRNFFRLGLFLAFFPQIVEGPICRYGQTAEQLWNAGPIRYENLTLGIQRIGYGLMKKLVVADRLNAFVGEVFGGYDGYSGGVIAIAAVCYTVQLYMDFSGSMDAVTGIGQIFGVVMPENFRQPFFSRTVSEFWTRWHISLGTWFKDYVFYPISMSKPMKKLTSSARKRLGNHFGPLVAGSIALFAVWFCNGAWHGAAWNFLFFGMYHFVIILGGSLIAPAVKKFNARFSLHPESLPYRFAQTIRTCVLVVIGELFFRAEGLGAGLGMFRKMVTDFRFGPLPGKLPIDGKDFFIAGVTLMIVFAVSLLHERGISVRAKLREKPTALRWAVLYALILYIILFGAYGKGYIPVNPMYADF